MITYLYFYRQNYVFLQVGFQRISFETREEFASYGPESLLGKWNIRIKRSLLHEGIERPSRKQTFDRAVMVHHAANTIHSVIYFFEKMFPSHASIRT